MNPEQPFLDFLYQRIGLDAASVGEATIARAVRLRQAAVHALTLADYWALLNSAQDEQQALIEAVIVPETWFMRYPESFAALGRLARARWSEQGSTRPLRLLSLPCSTGEEPYSLAMALFEAGLPPSAFIIDGVDVSPHSLAKARQGLYGRNSFRGDYKAFQARYFTAQADGHQLQARLANQVKLQVGNILDPLLLAGEPPYDVVFCRNLLIYFDVPTQQQVVKTLKRLVQPDGVLFIGPAEGSLLTSNGMRPLGIAQAFAFVRQPAPTVGAPSPVAPAVPPTYWSAPPSRLAPVTHRPAVISAPGTAPGPAPVSAPAAKAEQGTDSEEALLEHIAVLANSGRSAQAQAACERYLRDHPPHAQVFYWLGLLSDVSGDTLQAQGFYRKALYLDPQHAEALAHLAMLMAAKGDSEGAQRLQARALRARKEPDA